MRLPKFKLPNVSLKRRNAGKVENLLNTLNNLLKDREMQLGAEAMFADLSFITGKEFSFDNLESDKYLVGALATKLLLYQSVSDNLKSRVFSAIEADSMQNKGTSEKKFSEMSFLELIETSKQINETYLEQMKTPSLFTPDIVNFIEAANALDHWKRFCLISAQRHLQTQPEKNPEIIREKVLKTLGESSSKKNQPGTARYYYENAIIISSIGSKVYNVIPEILSESGAEEKEIETEKVIRSMRSLALYNYLTFYLEKSGSGAYIST